MKYNPSIHFKLLEEIKNNINVNKTGTYMPIELALLFKLKYGLFGEPFIIYPASMTSTYLSIGVVQDMLDRIKFTTEENYNNLTLNKQKLSASFSLEFNSKKEIADAINDSEMLVEITQVLNYELCAEIMLMLFKNRKFNMVIHDLNMEFVDNRLSLTLKYFNEPIE